MRRVVVAFAVMLAGAAAAAGAQVWTPRQPPGDTTSLRPEIRLDWLGGAASALHVGAGLEARAGNYLRVGANAGLGPDVTGGANDRAHVDATARFMLDPYRQQRIGLSFGGGVSARYQYERVRAFVLLFADAELSRRDGWVPFVRAGIGGGPRLAIGLRRMPTLGR